MAHWPKTISGNIFTIALAAIVVPMLVWFLLTLPALFQVGLGAVALGCVALYLWRRKLESARERNWVGEFSFGDVVARRRDEEALEVAAH
jgi:membrane protein implicated in regulation of membrane protease activity